MTALVAVGVASDRLGIGVFHRDHVVTLSPTLSHAQVQMARELGMNPAKLGKTDNHKQEKWKLPLPEFIEEIYLKRFGKTAPDSVMSIEDRHRLQQQKKEARRIAKQQRHGNSEGIEADLVVENKENRIGEELFAKFEY